MLSAYERFSLLPLAMCGIFGVTRPDLEQARAALATLTHRGPDQAGEWCDSGLYIGHRRLSILDLSEKGRQPMSDDAASVVIAVNGEIYNYRALKKELQKKYAFKSESDSEVVLYGYKEWGMDGLLRRIDGMYAFSVYDRQQQKLYLARDIAGIKPLYYYHADGVFAWGSELKALECYFGKDTLEIDQTALYDFLTYLYVPPPKSLYRNIHKLEAAHYVTFDLAAQTLSNTRYWALNPETKSIDPASARQALRGLVLASVEAQMISDVPVGFFLSGGIDSSTIVGCAAAVSDHINTYTIGFEEADFDESPFAEQVARLHDTRHHCRILDQSLGLDLYPRMKEWFDEPHADTSALPTFLVSQFAKEQVSVVLTGDGGDEIFGGYTHYFKFKAMAGTGHPRPAFLKAVTRRGKRWFQGKKAARAFANIERRFLLQDVELHARLLGGMLGDEKQAYRARFDIPEDYDDYWFFRKYYREELPLITRLQYLDFHTYLPEDILTKVDRASMAVSLEARVPFITREIIEFSFSLPESVRLPDNEPKGLLKLAFAELLPPGIATRKKKGFTVPLKVWREAFYGAYSYPQERLLDAIFLSS
jgi:asparagine synthase (glutamine-hydrolysing)